jgi:hypothetical protein
MHELFEQIVALRGSSYAWIPFGLLSLLGLAFLARPLLTLFSDDPTQPLSSSSKFWAASCAIPLLFAPLFWLFDFVAELTYHAVLHSKGLPAAMGVWVLVGAVLLPAYGAYVFLAAILRRLPRMPA